MNEADFDMLTRATRVTLTGPPGVVAFSPEGMMRIRALELAVRLKSRNEFFTVSTVDMAKEFYNFLKGDDNANLHSPKQDER